MRGPRWTRRRASPEGYGFRVGRCSSNFWNLMIFCDTWNFGGLFGVQILVWPYLVYLVVHHLVCYRYSFFVGQAAYELRVNHPLEILWRGGGEAKGERTGWALAGHQEKSPELSHRRMATSSKKTLFEVLLKRGSKRLPNPFFLVPRLSGKQWFFSCPKGLEDPQNQQIETIQQKKIGQDAGMSLNGSFSGEMSIHSHELLNGEPGQGLMNTHGLDVLQIRIARRSGLGTSRSWWSHKVSGWRWLHVCRFDWEHIWPFQLIYA